MRERSELKGARVVDEVREALSTGCWSKHKTVGFNGHPYPDCLYVWNDARAYALKLCDNGFVVVTVVPRS